MVPTEREGSFIETYRGERFFPFDPRPQEVYLEDIATGLSNTCRFGGHCRQFYSVALHSLHVSSELVDHPPRIQLFGLLHDAAEAYLGDIPRPIKAEFDDFEQAEERLLDAIWMAFDLRSPTADEWATVMAADDRLLAYEASELLSDGSWAEDPPDLNYELQADSLTAVRDRFIEQAEQSLIEVRC